GRNSTTKVGRSNGWKPRSHQVVPAATTSRISSANVQPNGPRANCSASVVTATPYAPQMRCFVNTGGAKRENVRATESPQCNRCGSRSISDQCTVSVSTGARRMKKAALALLAIVLQTAPRDVGWTMHGGNDNIRYSALTQINRDNVARLQVAWTYDSHDAFKGSEMQSNPVVVGGVLYATTPTLKVIALNAATGQELWKFDPSASAASGARFRHRGVTVHDDRVFVTYRNWLYALDKTSGKPIASFGADGRVDLREG